MVFLVSSAQLLGQITPFQGKTCLSSCCHLPPPNSNIAVDWVQLYRKAPPPSAFGGDDLGAGTAERLIDQIARIGKRCQHRLDQRHRKYRRM